MPDGREAVLVRFASPAGLIAEATNYGVKLVSLRVPDRQGDLADIVLGYPSLDGYLHGHRFFGANCGRVAGRIAQAEFTLDEKKHTLTANENKHHLHGGVEGFDSVLWDVVERTDAVCFHLHSDDGAEGYPGNLDVEICYSWRDDKTLLIEYTAMTDAATPVNIAHHSYFNLTGEAFGSIGHHSVKIFSDRVLDVDNEMIPTGNIAHVDGTPLDLRAPVTIGGCIDADSAALRIAGGFDQCFILQREGEGLVPAAVVYDPFSGRRMDVFTTHPCLVFYSGNFCDGVLPGKSGVVAGRRSALCLEPQGYTDAPNHPEFPSVILEPGMTYRHQNAYLFSTY